MNNEFEVVLYERLRHISVFLNRVTYRNFHIHGAFELLLVLEGRGEISIAGEKISLEPDSIVMTNPYEAHEISGVGGSMLLLVVQFSPHFLGEYVPELQSTRFLCHDISGALREEMQQQMKEKLVEIGRSYLGQEETFSLSCVALSAQVLERLFISLPRQTLTVQHRSALKQQNDRIQRILNYIELHYLEPIRLETLANMEGLTTTYVSHLISESIGVSFQEYLNNLRFEKAMDYLRSTNMTLTEIAAASGFSDLKYLNKVALKRRGCPLSGQRAKTAPGISRVSGRGVEPLEYRFSREEGCSYLERLVSSWSKQGSGGGTV